MKNIREAVRDIIAERVLPMVERDGISKLILPEQISSADCVKPMKCKNPPYFVQHREHEIGFGLTGKTPYCIDDKRLLITPGRIAVLPAGTPHTSDQNICKWAESLDIDRHPSSIWMLIYPFGMRVQISQMPAKMDTIEITPAYMLLSPYFNGLMLDLLDEVRSVRASYAGVAKGILVEFLHRCLRASDYVEAPLNVPVYRWFGVAGKSRLRGRLTASKTDQSATDPIKKYRVLARVQDAQDFIHSHYNTTINVEDIAEAADTSDTHLRRLFKATTGETPMQYLLNIRIEAAMQLLQTDLKVSEVSRLVGIEDAYYFSRAFRRINGMSPVQYRRWMLEEAEPRTSARKPVNRKGKKSSKPPI